MSIRLSLNIPNENLLQVQELYPPRDQPVYINFRIQNKINCNWKALEYSSKRIKHETECLHQDCQCVWPLFYYSVGVPLFCSPAKHNHKLLTKSKLFIAVELEDNILKMGLQQFGFGGGWGIFGVMVQWFCRQLIKPNDFQHREGNKCNSGWMSFQL